MHENTATITVNNSESSNDLTNHIVGINNIDIIMYLKFANLNSPISSCNFLYM